MSPTFLLSTRKRIWLFTQNLKLRLLNRKLSLRNIEPFKVIKPFNKVTYKLKLPANPCVSLSFHVSCLKSVHLSVDLNAKKQEPSAIANFYQAKPKPHLNNGDAHSLIRSGNLYTTAAEETFANVWTPLCPLPQEVLPSLGT